MPSSLTKNAPRPNFSQACPRQRRRARLRQETVGDGQQVSYRCDWAHHEWIGGGGLVGEVTDDGARRHQAAAGAAACNPTRSEAMRSNTRVLEPRGSREGAKGVERPSERARAGAQHGGGNGRRRSSSARGGTAGCFYRRSA
jgi:hypothetical protein